MARPPKGLPANWPKIAFDVRYNAIQFARAAKMHPRTLNRRTREAFGCSAQDWLDGEQVAAAAELLRQERSVKVATQELFFSSRFQFTRKFKKHLKITPRKFLSLLPPP